MPLISSLSIISLFFAGILAGVEVASHYGFVIHPPFLGEADQVRLRQALIRRLRVLVPAIFGPALLTALAMTVWSVPGLRLGLRGAALAGDIFWIYARVVATMRINRDTLGWNPASPPAGWRGLIDSAERYHIASLWAVTTGFLCLLLAATP
jgi:hypothetical protein